MGGLEIRATDGKGHFLVLDGRKNVGGLAGDFLDVVHTNEARPFAGAADGFGVAQALGAQAGLEGASDAELLGNRAGVDAFEAGDIVRGQVFIERLAAAPTAGDGAQFADDVAGDLGAIALGVKRVDAVVADLRRGHRDDLGKIGRVGQNLLVARHAGVENGLAEHRFPGAKRRAAEHTAIFQGQHPFCLNEMTHSG